MKTTMKKSIAYLLVALLVFQIVPAFADQTQIIVPVTTGSVTFREKLQITAADNATSIAVGMDLQLNITEGYENTNWSSSNEAVATVDKDGKVTAYAPGQVRITVEAEGTYADSITLRVIGTSSDNTDNEKMIIFINGSKEKVIYDGQVHKATYTATSNSDRFDPSKLTMVNEDKQVSGKDCNVYADNLTEEDFQYEGEDAEFVITNGWVQIKPAKINIKADDITVLNPNEEPKYTASVTEGLIAGDELDLSQVEFQIQGNYILPDIQKGEIIGNYKVDNVLAGTLTVAKEQPLYNNANIGGTFYRLRKTSIWNTKDISEYMGGLKDGNTKKLTADDNYYVEDYDFANEIITVNKKTYAHISRFGEINDVDGYYEAKVDSLCAAKQKIGGMNGNTPRWAITEGRYDDDNKTDSFHRDFIITLIDKKDEIIEQPLYNYLSISGKYYRLQATKIYARSIEEVVEKNEFGNINSSKHPYKADGYDFSNLVIERNGKKYVYRESADNLPDEYVSFYTVKLDKVTVPNTHKMNQDAAWYDNEDGWLDGAHWDVPNETDAYHRDYVATFYEGNIEEAEEPEGTVTVTSSLEGVTMVFTGTEITLTAIVTGYENGYDLQWQYEDPSNPGVLHDIEGETNDTYTFNLDSTNCRYVYYATVTGK